ncbi:MAG TPA: ACT domain-containing protein [Abditibacteriaceae bacterium]|jgi:glycine cleavage system transcriptional repressor|nr:ACT domain-containing protein [Abditibacteriaceae bacterium]
MIIITAVGKDRPGMAHALAQKLAQSGCNIEDTTMTRLSGEFAMILIVSPPQHIAPEEMMQTLKPLENSHGLFINCRAIEDSAEDEDGEAPRYLLSVYGPERAGLVAQITGVLAQRNINITDVQTRVASAGAAYIMLFEIELPTGLDAQTLTASLEDAAHDIGAQVSLHAIESETL